MSTIVTKIINFKSGRHRTTLWSLSTRQKQRQHAQAQDQAREVMNAHDVVEWLFDKTMKLVNIAYLGFAFVVLFFDGIQTYKP